MASNRPAAQSESTQLVLRSLITGSFASIITTAVLALAARAEGKSVVQPTNSTSHWLHGDSAGRVKEPDIPHTLIGYATHHASAIVWALPLEVWLQGRPRTNAGAMFAYAACIAATAAVVDYKLVPKRLTPGWEEVLPARSIAVTFGALALGLGIGAVLARAGRTASAEQQT